MSPGTSLHPIHRFFVLTLAGLVGVAVVHRAGHAAEPTSRPATPSTTTQPATHDVEPDGVDRLMREAAALEKLTKFDLTRQFLKATSRLPRIAPRVLYFDPSDRAYYSEKSHRQLAADKQKPLQRRVIDETIYYYTKYGTPLAYSRVLEVLGAHGVHDLSGRRVLDYGYGTVGHLRLMASLGADAVGVDVDPLLRELYSESMDAGTVKGASGHDGRVTMVDGRWPGDAAAKTAVGGKFDIISSKNTLKNGYLHPAQPVDKRMLVDLGVDEMAFVEALAAAVKPGGHVIIYNICPAPSPPDKPYIPWADGRCPFPRDMWEKAGFEVLEFDANDSEAVRKMGEALGWDAGDGAMNLENDLFAHYSLFRRKP